MHGLTKEEKAECFERLERTCLPEETSTLRGLWGREDCWVVSKTANVQTNYARLQTWLEENSGPYWEWRVGAGSRQYSGWMQSSPPYNKIQTFGICF